MRAVFFGTPTFAVPSLQALTEAGVEIVAVVTQPDRPRGRSHSTLIPSPVKQFATTLDVPVLQPDRPRGSAFMNAIQALKADVGIVVAYGHLLKPELLHLPRLGCVNVHASLLPRWRGAAPIQWSVMAGDTSTGVSIMRMEAGLDTGPVWLQASTPIGNTETAGDLFERLADLGAVTLVSSLPIIETGIAPSKQDEEAATYAPKIDRLAARIEWGAPADQVSCLIRAMDPAPGAWTTLGDVDCKLFGAVSLGGSVAGPPGTVTIETKAIQVSCDGGVVAISEVQPAGKRRMTASDWYNGGGIPVGAKFT
jgi:methionyl-tRNA formyltransferase